jgi:hypothetical protein
MRGLIVSCSVVVSLFGSSFAQALEWPVCLQNLTGMRSCVYATFAQCQAAAASRSVGSDCVANPNR